MSRTTIAIGQLHIFTTQFPLHILLQGMHWHWPILECFSRFYLEDGVNFKSARSIRNLHRFAFNAHGPELEHRRGTDERVENHKRKDFQREKIML